jgi:hypothetical protein
MIPTRSAPIKRSEINQLRANKNKFSCSYSSIFKQGDLYYYVDGDGKPHGPFQTLTETELAINKSSSK